MKQPQTLYIKWMESTNDPEDGFFLACDYPTNGASRYQLAPEWGESETNMKDPEGFKLSETSKPSFQQMLDCQDEVIKIHENTIAALTAANEKQVQRIERLIALLKQAVPLLQRCKRNISAQMPGVPHTIEGVIEEFTCKIEDELDVTK